MWGRRLQLCRETLQGSYQLTKPLLLLSPNLFSVNGHTYSELYITVEVLLSHCKMQVLKLSTQQCSKEIWQMLNVNFFPYQPI